MDPSSRTLEIRFVLTEDSSLSPTDFVALFQCAEDYSRYVAEQEALSLLDQLGLSSEQRLGTMRLLVKGRPPSPAEVLRVGRASPWEVVLTLSSAGLLYLLKEYVHPAVKEAWDQSHLREQLVVFMRERAFRGVKRKAEERAIEKPRFGNLEVAAVKGSEDDRHPTLEVRLERREVLQVRTTDPEVIEEFLRRLRR